MLEIKWGAGLLRFLSVPPTRTAVLVSVYDLWEVPSAEVPDVFVGADLDPSDTHGIRLDRAATRDDLLQLDIMRGFKIVQKEDGDG